ncbi:ferredoxin reductase family protein [Demequina zhanjiangensis]|uniref:Ferric reductase-like transmembrane domain-containing protein n=1 Tax=Demequina zhanjiangensis TaxID=3051659 RepID=A0ABT8G321_9MICO|nr:ferric reductase-like transmembrane domain-containing protein [Demequina sp. SYSU T00b26]MDN4473545.1 ferric reductase-like transmembrane domain-containing protein [Demequina sp. SYSU T00b26]
MSATTARPTTAHHRVRASARRGWWADGLEAAIWFAAAIGVALMLHAGGLLVTAPIDYLYTAGRAFGIVATVLMLAQVLLVSRAPWVEGALGHDRAASLHSRAGKWAIILMLTHAAVIVSMTGYYDGRSPFAESLALFSQAWYLAAAQIALVLFLVVLALSLAIVRNRWRYERWHTVHLIVYLAVAAAVPHQFLEGSTFRGGDPATWYWLALYVVAFGSLLGYRVLRPLVRLRRHDPRVAAVRTLPDGSTDILVSGRGLEALRAQPGQFLLWRFMDSRRWREAHPFSLSAAPRDDALRLTVKPSGDFSGELSELKVGTRVMLEGPLGVFTDRSRCRRGTVLVAAGIGVTPVRSMLEAMPADEPCTVIVRIRSGEEAPLLDEVRDLAAGIGAELHVLEGPRGASWAPAGTDVSLSALVRDLHDRDVFVCGPVPWADQVERDARAAGVAAEAIHRERFGW